MNVFLRVRLLMLSLIFAMTACRGSQDLAAQERDVAAARQKYRRELFYCKSLRPFEGDRIPIRAGGDEACLRDFAVEYKDPFFCSEVPAGWRWRCSEWLARATGKSELCDGIPNPWMKWDCYLDTAAATGDARPCDRILDAEARRRECEQAGGDLCGELNAQNSRQNYEACVAIAQRSPSACEAVSYKPARLGCLRRVAALKRDPVLCESLRIPQASDLYQDLLYQCWKDVAVANAKLEDCDRIPHPGVRINTSGSNIWKACRREVEIRQVNVPCREDGSDFTCQGKMAAAKNDFKTCGSGQIYSVRGEGARAAYNICALTFAFRKNDASACASIISDERLRSICLELAAGPRSPSPPWERR